jgi:hypothetical protein
MYTLTFRRKDWYIGFTPSLFTGSTGIDGRGMDGLRGKDGLHGKEEHDWLVLAQLASTYQITLNESFSLYITIN